MVPWFLWFPSLAQLEEDEELPEDAVDDQGFTRASLFLPHFTCAGLLSLHLGYCVFDDAEAGALCQFVPQLTELHLWHVGWPSFHPLRHLKKLAKLCLRPAEHTHFSLSMAHLQSLTSLRSLALDKMRPPFKAATVAALQPPSVLMQNLTAFKYSA